MAAEIDLPSGWQQTAEAVEAEGGTAVILGASDSGKTTLLKFLVERLGHQSRQVAVVDADLGQSTLGPPATISGAVLGSQARSLEKAVPQEMFFVGATSPSGHLLQTLAGVKKITEWAESTGVSSILVDTTGMILGQVASLFKYYKIDLLRPRHLLVLQRSQELEPLLRRFEGRKALRLYRLRVSHRARSRTPQERRAYRSGRFQDYFKGGSVALISSAGMPIINERSPHLARYGGGFPRYLLVGLNDVENRTLALGIIEAFDPQSRELFIYTPLSDLSPLRSIVLGSLRVDLKGRELE